MRSISGPSRPLYSSGEGAFRIPYLIRESKEIGTVQSEILRVPTGMTGPWQVAGRNHASFGERVRMNAQDVRDWSVWLDLIILARTAKCVVLAKGAW